MEPKKTLPIVSIILGLISFFMFMSKDDAFKGMAMFIGLAAILCTLISVFSKKYYKTYSVLAIIISIMSFFMFIYQISKPNKKVQEYRDKYDSQTFVISFDTDGGNAISPITVTPNTYLSPVIPSKSGYKFTNWTLNGEAFSLTGYVNSRITSNVTLKANYEKINTTTSTPSNKPSSNNNNNSSTNNTNPPTTTESKSSYISSCQNYDSKYDDMRRNPNSYKGLRMKFRGMVENRWTTNGSLSAFTISACTSNNWHVGEIYCTIDSSVLNGMNLLQYDYVNVYGEFKGLTDNLYNWSRLC